MKKVFYTILFILIIHQPLFAEEIKKADLAGSWYPADKKELSDLLKGYIDQAYPKDIDGRILGMISPHAGYVFSGRTAGFGFKAVQGRGYKTVIILGFGHRKSFDGISVYDTGSFRTPLGDAAVDADLAKRLIDPDQHISFYPGLFDDENSVEMIIPFVQVALPDAKIVPAAFGKQDYALCESLAKKLAGLIKGRDDVLIIASTDMSHYHPYDDANRIDEFTMKKIRAFKAKELYDELNIGTAELCGASTVTTMLLTMGLLGADNIAVLKHENSGDVTGDISRVVGYMAAVFYKTKSEIRNPKSEINSKSQIPNDKIKEGETDMLNEKQRKRLLEIARTAVEEHVKNGKEAEFSETDPELLKQKGAFVTLHYKGDLRGCIGNIIGRQPLYKTIRDMAIEASANDPRFMPVTAGELKDIKIEISVLSEPERVTDVSKIVMGKHGVIVKKGFNSGVFLPQVATETGWDRDEFLSVLCTQKAGLPADAWKDPKTELYTFTAEVFGEE